VSKEVIGDTEDSDASRTSERRRPAPSSGEPFGGILDPPSVVVMPRS